jgi:hypothetical protein
LDKGAEADWLQHEFSIRDCEAQYAHPPEADQILAEISAALRPHDARIAKQQ